MSHYNNISDGPKYTFSVHKSAYKTSDIPMGVCCRCKKVQTSPAEGGIWICGMKNRWACYDCFYGKNGEAMHSRPAACEWCTSNDVKWMQGGYDCNRCNALRIGQSKF